jgi:hypothetical protein
MATRSTIALEFADGTVGQIYCHWDGYLSNNGEILLKHYSDPFKVRDLIDQGDLSSLRPEIGIPHPFSYIGEMPAEEYDRLYGDMCTFYMRDRGETGCEAKKFKDFEDYAESHQYEEYEYILRRDGQWYVDQYGKGYTLLKDEVERERAVEETLDA